MDKGVQIDYSEDFNKILSDKKKLDHFLRGFFHQCENVPASYSFDVMERERFIVSRAVHRRGTILDIGCSNGFLLRCLQEWSGYALKPYGIDNDLRRINLAKEIFPSMQGNFVFADFWDLISKTPLPFGRYSLPSSYDFIYWNVWDDVMFTKKKEISALLNLYGSINKGGRLILGFYRPGGKPDNLENKGKISLLSKKGINFSGVLEDSQSNVVAWINK